MERKAKPYLLNGDTMSENPGTKRKKLRTKQRSMARTERYRQSDIQIAKDTKAYKKREASEKAEQDQYHADVASGKTKVKYGLFLGPKKKKKKSSS